MPYLAGVRLDEQQMKGLVLTVAMPDVPIFDPATQTSERPADDLAGFITRALGLDPGGLTARQGAEIDAFITENAL